MRERGENKGLNQPEHPVRITSSAELMPARSRAAMLACSTFRPLVAMWQWRRGRRGDGTSRLAQLHLPKIQGSSFPVYWMCTRRKIGHCMVSYFSVQSGTKDLCCLHMHAQSVGRSLVHLVVPGTQLISPQKTLGVLRTRLTYTLPAKDAPSQ